MLCRMSSHTCSPCQSNPCVASEIIPVMKVGNELRCSVTCCAVGVLSLLCCGVTHVELLCCRISRIVRHPVTAAYSHMLTDFSSTAHGVINGYPELEGLPFKDLHSRFPCEQCCKLINCERLVGSGGLYLT